LKVETSLDKLSYCSLFSVKAIFAESLIHIEIQYLLFDNLWILAIEWVRLVKDVVDAAAQRPNINLLAKAVLL